MLSRLDEAKSQRNRSVVLLSCNSPVVLVLLYIKSPERKACNSKQVANSKTRPCCRILLGCETILPTEKARAGIQSFDDPAYEASNTMAFLVAR